MKKLELLAPAGDLEKLKTAVFYGADAVYFGGEMFSLRAGAGNLTIPEMVEGIRYAHENDAKCYLTVNIYAHNEDIEPLKAYLESVKSLGIDGYLVSDPGIVMLVKDIIPDAEIHLSTQANMTNYETAKFWKRLGVKRIVMARELSFDEIKDIIKHGPEDMEYEAFGHGAMCISYSGRCLLSNFMTGRDANRGACAHPCRYKYVLEEEKRPGEYYPIIEDDRGTYIMNSRDLCMIEHIKDFIESGVTSLKIEGRMKSSFYVATVVRAYRAAIDAYYADPDGYRFKDEWMEELLKESHREFTTGFFYHKPTAIDQNYQTSAYTRDYSFVGLVLDYDESTGFATIEQRNKMIVGDTLEVFGPDISFFTHTIKVMYNEEGESILEAPHPQQIIKIKLGHEVKPGYMLRVRKDN